jgi:Putative Actinobacterial Holin-X, holin superfamily III
MSGEAAPGESVIGLARSLVRGMVALARLEMTRARQEIWQMTAPARTGVILLGVAAAMVFGVLIAVIVFLILLVDALLPVPGWAAALIVMGVLLIGAGLLAWAGIRRILAARFWPPEETIAAVKEDVAWAKRLLRRG